LGIINGLSKLDRQRELLDGVSTVKGLVTGRFALIWHLLDTGADHR
jgi:hypothetical protein